ncbi:hypothetical protein BGZ83_008751 [Gryganskiella cystojenkinii]|nr:hypothetical protein BGZ83_008751 [Gryganskiella cystojenkinii]
MDPSPTYSLNGFIYTPLSDTGMIVNSGTPITSWPSYDGTMGYKPVSLTDYQYYAQQQKGPNQQQSHQLGFTVDYQEQNKQGSSSSLLSHISSSSLSSSSPPSPSSSSLTSPSTSSSSCHPFDLPPIITKNLDSLLPTIDSMDMLHQYFPSSNTHDNNGDSSLFGTQDMINLSPYCHLTSAGSTDISRCSSTTGSSGSGCIDPSTLMMSESASSTAVSSMSSPPASHRPSMSYSVSGEESTRNMTFAEVVAAYNGQRAALTLAARSCTPDPESNRETPTTTTMMFQQDPHQHQPLPPLEVYTQDFMLADGTRLRFDGHSLVPASSSSMLESPVLTVNPAELMHNPVSNNNMSVMSPSSYIPYAEFSQLGIHSNPGSPSPSPISPHPTGHLPFSSSSSTLSMSLRERPQPRHKKTTLLRKSVFEDRRRRGSADSAYHSSSSSSSSSSGQSLTRTRSSSVPPSSLKTGPGSQNRYRKDGVGEFKCPFDGCDYHYNLRRELNRHRNVHVFAGRDKYRCMNCNSGLCRLDSVKRHMEAKGKSECLKRGLYQEFREDGELVRIRQCKPNWYEGAAAVAAAAAAQELRRRRK